MLITVFMFQGIASISRLGGHVDLYLERTAYLVILKFTCGASVKSFFIFFISLHVDYSGCDIASQLIYYRSS